MRALVLGASGTLGQALATFLATPEGGAFEVDARTRSDCDVTNASAVGRTISESEADVVFNAAAYANVEGAESDPEAAYLANALGPETLARVTAGLGVKLVHYSTDFVFDGELARPYDEFDETSPQGIYARSKVAGERLAAAASSRLYIVRVGCLYGRGGRNFPSTIVPRLLAGETISADSERLASPTWVRDVVYASAALAHSDAFGLYHCTSGGACTWADYARFLAAELRLPEARVNPVSSTALPLMRAPRPRRAILDNRMLRLRGIHALPDWQVAARAFLRAETRGC